MGEAIIAVGCGEAAPGQEVPIAVFLHTGGRPIAGVQVDLAPDRGVYVNARPNGRPDGNVNPELRKESTAFAFQPAGCSGVECTSVRAIVLSMSNLDLIPDGAELFTITLTVDPATPPGVYRIRASNAAAASPEGSALPTIVEDGSIEVVPPPIEVVPSPDDKPISAPEPEPRVRSLRLVHIDSALSVVSSLMGKRQRREFDVFLSYNREDRELVRDIAMKLKDRGVWPWFDQWELQPGRPWQRALEEQIASIKSAAVFVGSSGVGPWQSMEIESHLREFVERDAPVIPVLLGEARKPHLLPLFLKNMTWVDFSSDEYDPIDHLLWGITGERVE